MLLGNITCSSKEQQHFPEYPENSAKIYMAVLDIKKHTNSPNTLWPVQKTG